MKDIAIDRGRLLGAGQFCAEEAGENAKMFVDNGMQTRAITVINRNADTGKYELIALAELKGQEFHIFIEPESKMITNLLIENNVSPNRIKYQI